MMRFFLVEINKMFFYYNCNKTNYGVGVAVGVGVGGDDC